MFRENTLTGPGDRSIKLIFDCFKLHNHPVGQRWAGGTDSKGIIFQAYRVSKTVCGTCVVFRGLKPKLHLVEVSVSVFAFLSLYGHLITLYVLKESASQVQ